MDHKIKEFKIVGGVGVILRAITEEYRFANVDGKLLQIIGNNSSVEVAHIHNLRGSGKTVV